MFKPKSCEDSNRKDSLFILIYLFIYRAGDKKQMAKSRVCIDMFQQHQTASKLTELSQQIEYDNLHIGRTDCRIVGLGFIDYP